MLGSFRERVTPVCPPVPGRSLLRLPPQPHLRRLLHQQNRHRRPPISATPPSASSPAAPLCRNPRFKLHSSLHLPGGPPGYPILQDPLGHAHSVFERFH